MYLHDLCRFDSTYTRSQSPSGPAITPQNESSCGTVGFLAGKRWNVTNKILRPRNIGAYATGNSAKIWTPEGPSTHNPVRYEPVIALRIAVRSIIRSTSLSRYHFGTVFICVVGWSFSTWWRARKTILYNTGPFT